MSKKQLRNYLTLMVAVIVGVTVIIFLYGAISPYQNCVRGIEADRVSQFSFCVENTSW